MNCRNGRNGSRPLLFIALVGARIAHGQRDVSRSKLKLDLFDRRFALYLVAAKFLSNVLQEGNASNGAINQYSREILDAVRTLIADAWLRCGCRSVDRTSHE